MKKQRKYLIVLILATLVFIWGHSVMDREQSAAESGLVLKVITPLLELFLGKGNVTEHLVRKMAHFGEFSVLGAELFCFFQPAYLKALSHGMLAAMVDETIQIFSGRGSQLQDVWLDSFGAAFGAAAACLLIHLIRRKAIKKAQN